MNLSFKKKYLKLVWVFLAACAAGCTGGKESGPGSESGYLSTDSVLNAMASRYESIPAEVHLKIGSDSDVVQRSLIPVKDWDFLNEQSLHKPFYKGMFVAEKQGDTLLYTSLTPQTSDILYQQWVYDSLGNLRQIMGRSFKENFLYTTQTEFEINFAGAKPQSHRMSGFQKIVFFDTAFYNARAVYRLAE